MNETRDLARFANKLQLADVPRAVRDKAIDILIDQIGIQMVCATLPWSKQITRMVEKLGGGSHSTVVYYGFRTSPDNAGFLNSSYGHGFEMDDTHLRVVNHPGCLAIPSALAISEQRRLSGKEALLGMIIGLELICRVSAVSGTILLRGGQNTHPPNAPFGIAAACARLLGLGEAGVLNAMGIAGSHSAAGLRVYNQTGGTLKRLHGGIPVQAGIRSALLAEEGITGPPTILEGKFGFLRVMCNQTELEPMMADLGSDYIFTEVAFKKYCTVYFIQSPLDAACKIIDQYKPDFREIKEVIVGTSEEGVLHAGAIIEPRDIGSAQFSICFSMALRFVKGGNGFLEYIDENLIDPDVLALAHKVRVEVDDQAELAYPKQWGSIVTVVMKSGQRYQERVPAVKGSHEFPLTREEIRDKFRRLVAGRMSPRNAECLLERLENIEQLADVSQITSLFAA